MDNEHRICPLTITGAAVPESTGWSYRHKISMQVPDAVRAPISFPEAGEIAIFATRPLCIAIDDPTKWMGPAAEFRLGPGRARRIFVDPGTVHSIEWKKHRITFYIGRPNLGPNFHRDDPFHAQREKVGVALAAWAALADTVASATITYPVLCPMPSTPLGLFDRHETTWLWGFEWTRNGGNVEGLQLAEQVTGAATRIFSYRLSTPADRGCVMFPQPWPLHAAGIWYMYGSVELAVTPCTLHLFTGNT